MMELCKGSNNKQAADIRSLLRDRLWFGYIKWKDFKKIHMLSLLAKWPISLLIAFHQNHFVCAQHTESYQKTWAKEKQPDHLSLALQQQNITQALKS